MIRFHSGRLHQPCGRQVFLHIKKQKRRDPIKVMLVWTVCLAVLAAGALYLGSAITDYRA